MDRKNAENILMFSEAIAANGYKVLTRAKFIKYVTKKQIKEASIFKYEEELISQ